MNPLALSFQTQMSLRTKQRIALAVLPTGLMFFSVVPLLFFSVWLTQKFGIPDGSTVRDSLEISTLLTVMLVFMCLGYLLGWFINAVVMLLIFKWPIEKVRKVFLFSEVPPEWRKYKISKGEVVCEKKGVKDQMVAILALLAACLISIFIGNYIAEYCKRANIDIPKWASYLYLVIPSLVYCHFNDVFQNNKK